jgi:hypothetical protein
LRMRPKRWPASDQRATLLDPENSSSVTSNVEI